METTKIAKGQGPMDPGKQDYILYKVPDPDRIEKEALREK
jgi:hypothetical protein